MKKKSLRRTGAVVLSLALSVACVPSSTQAATKNKVTRKKITRFEISKKSGTYVKKVKVKIKAKKKYNVYYTTSKKFSKKKVIKAGKLKSFKFNKTTTLKVFALKKSKKITTKKLNKLAMNSKRLHAYKYVVVKESNNNENNNQNGKEDKKTTDNIKESNDIVNNFQKPYDEKDFEIPEVTYEDNAKVDEEANKITETTPVVAFAEDGVSIKVNNEEVKPDGITIGKIKDVNRILITEDGTYAFTGNVKNAIFVVASENVNLIFKDFTVDDAKLAEVSKGDNSIISAEAGSNVKVTLVGENNIYGNENFVKEPKAIIDQKSDKEKASTFTIVNGGNGELNILDSMVDKTDFAGKDPVDGIATKGTLIIKSGNVKVTSTGACLKGTGANGEGGVKILGGNLKLASYNDAAIASKNGTIDVKDGVINVVYAADDAINAKNYSANISGGYLKADNIYGDGIQAENVNISGGNVVIKTYFENAGLNYFNPNLGEGKYNQFIKNDNFNSSYKKEIENVDTGSHKGIKAGSKDYYYVYKTVKEGSKNVAGEEYHKDASGGINITGGYINIDTTNTGIKYTADGLPPRPPVGASKPDDGQTPIFASEEVNAGNLTKVGENQIMLGCPEDGIKSQNSFTMTGGKIVINSSDDGISINNDTTITGDSKIYINRAYEGFESKNLTLGTEGGNDSPYVYVHTWDDGVNVSDKYKILNTYEDETEKNCVTETYARTGGVVKMYSGEINVDIANNNELSYNLHVKDGFGVVEDDSYVGGSIFANGDGIDCNGSFYGYGGKVMVHGTLALGANSPIDCNDVYYLGEGIEVYAAGNMEMPENPTELKQPIIAFGTRDGEFLPPPPPFPFPEDGEGFDPGEGFMPPPPPPGDLPEMLDETAESPLGIKAGCYFKIVDEDGNIVFSEIADRAYRYVMYVGPGVKNGKTYTLVSEGTKTETVSTMECPEPHSFGPRPQFPQGEENSEK